MSRSNTRNFSNSICYLHFYANIQTAQKEEVILTNVIPKTRLNISL